jgi:hypothetical protein
VASALSAEKHALRRASVNTETEEVAILRGHTFVKGLEFDGARKWLRRTIAHYAWTKRCTGGKCGGQILIRDKVGEGGDVEERFMQVRVRLWFGRFVGIIGRRGVGRCHGWEERLEKGRRGEGRGMDEG